MRITRLLTLFALITGLVVGLTASPAGACSCMEVTDDDSFDYAEAVFTGQIVEIREEGDHQVFLVDVDAVWKGSVTRWQAVRSPIESSACGIMLPLETPVVLFGHHDSEPESYEIGLCDPNRATGSETLFEGREVTDPAPGGTPPDWLTESDPVDDTPPIPENHDEPLPEPEPESSNRTMWIVVGVALGAGLGIVFAVRRR